MIKLEQENDKTYLYLEGEMTVNNAEAFRENLLLSLKQSNLVEIDFEAVTSVDLSYLQLICSAHRFAAADQRPLPTHCSDPDQKADCNASRHS